MAFLIRHISFTADHREIVRDTRIDRDTLMVGRAAENEVALPDLAVDPQHARIERRDARRILVAATGKLGFEVDGRTAMRAEIDSAKGAELGFGGHRITVSRSDAGDVVLAVQRVDAISVAEEDRDEATAFSLRGKLPGRRVTAWLLVAAVLIGFLAVPIWGFFHQTPEDHRSIYALHADRSWSPGPLSAAHHALEKNCESCHVQAFVAVRDSTCRTCHQDAHDHAPADRIAAARAAPTAWGRFLESVAHAFNKPGPGACVDCHREHEGAGPMQATPQAFCTECHSGLNQRLTDTRLPNAGDFGTAHPQFRPTIGGERVSLDGHPTLPTGLKFPHDLHLSSTNGVARMAQTLSSRYGFGAALDCKDCHKPSADGVRYLPVQMEQACGMCHSLGSIRHGDVRAAMADARSYYRATSAPRPIEMGGGRRRPGLYAEGQVYHIYFSGAGAWAGRGEAAAHALLAPGGACYECHTPTTSELGVVPVPQPMRYMLHGWFDHAAHKTEACASCHDARASASATDLLLPGIKTCRTCHGGETSSAQVPSSCAMCHSYHPASGAPWQPRRLVARTDAMRGGETPPGRQ